jgi:hypothetical protein
MSLIILIQFVKKKTLFEIKFYFLIKSTKLSFKISLIYEKKIRVN